MFKNYANFSARTSRRGYWMAFLINFIVAIVLATLFVQILGISFVYYLYALAVLVPGIAMGIRRLRDAGKPWWWLIIPIANIVMLAGVTAPQDEHKEVPVI